VALGFPLDHTYYVFGVDTCSAGFYFFFYMFVSLPNAVCLAFFSVCVSFFRVSRELLFGKRSV